MQPNISNKPEEKFKKEMEKNKKSAGEQVDTSKLEAEGTCEIVVGKDEKEVCDVKT
jgi:uncharacterized protein YjbJ (UPF0337 family)